jgi:hypothetical protein
MPSIHALILLVGTIIGAHGTRTYAVHVDGLHVGYVYDYREFNGHAVTGRRWGAYSRQDGDRAARWSTTGHGTRTTALAALLEVAR